MPALLYLLLYLFCGLLIVRCLLPRHSVLTRLWLGASLGLLLLMWLPALMAFAADFTMKAHLLALIPLAGLTLTAALLRDKRPARGWDAAESTLLGQMLLVVLPLTLLSAYLQYTHCVRIEADGSWWGGQSTYGDLAMHMSFVTSLKNAAFPPEYALFPGQQLSYPFLTDSLSTSFYLLGWPLQLSLTVPGTLMMALCYMGVMCLARRLTAGKKTVILAALLFFLNGGLGFIYDFDLAGGTETVWMNGEWTETPTVGARVRNILQGYYTTPTNQPTPNNLRWSNVIADLMLPQRTLLGGWCMVIPCFYLLLTAFGARRDEGNRARQLVLLGVWGGALPLIHTHSFTALALCSVGVMIYDLCHAGDKRVLPMRQRPRWLRIAVTASLLAVLATVVVGLGVHVLTQDVLPAWTLWGIPAAGAAAALVILFADLLARGVLCPAAEALEVQGRKPARRGVRITLWVAAALRLLAMAGLLLARDQGKMVESCHLALCGGMASLMLAAAAYSGVRVEPQEGAQPVRLWKELGWYLLYGGIACVLSVPQLFGFTFGQVFQEGMQEASNSFIQPWFNWVNSTDGTFSGMIDGYGWFYLKNIGLPFLMLIFALFERRPAWRRLFAGALPIILAAEFIRFQPNIYDNNKLLYLAWLLCAIIVADWCGVVWRKLKDFRARPVIAVLAAVTIFLSAGLTLWRECVSNYQLFSAGAVQAGEYVRDETEEDAVFLTGVHHLNPVASIGGRRIVCGPDLWLYYHGLDTNARKADIGRFYADPEGNQDVIARYGVDYVAVSSYERNDYRVNTAALDRLYSRVYQNGEMTIWRVQAEVE